MIWRITMLGVLALEAGCFEVIEHQPAVDTCSSNAECPCSQECAPTDAGRACLAVHPVTCLHSTECTQPLVCNETRRDAGCGYFECQLPPDSGH